MNQTNCSHRLRASLLTALTSVLLAAPSARADYESTVLGDQPIAYYPMYLNNGTAVDLTGNGNDGTYVNIYPGFNNVPGPSPYITNGVSFDGFTTYVDLGTGSNPALLDFGGTISMEAWVQSSSTSGNGYILGKGYDAFNNGNENVLRCPGFGVYQGGTYNNTAGGVLATGGQVTTNWEHIVCTHDGAQWNLYVSGVKVATTADAVGALNWSAPWAIGNGTLDGGTRIFTGNIAQVALYTNALSSNQVLAHYYVGIYGTTNVPPVITLQPASQVAAPGATVAFSYQAQSLLSVTNQWFKNGSPLSNQTNATLTLANVQTNDSGAYTVVVGNSAGSVTSVVANLSVKSVGIYGFSPVPLTAGSYNHDIIIEKGALVPATTATMDGNIGNFAATWFEQGYYSADPAIGLPAPGSTFASVSLADHSFAMAPSFTTNNAIFLNDIVTNATWTVTTPVAVSSLSFLCSAAYGDTLINYTVHHADSSTEAGTFTAPDWFGAGTTALGVGGRVDAATRGIQTWAPGDVPRIYSQDIALANTVSPVTSIVLSFNSGGNACVLAVSGSSGGAFSPIAVTGYNHDMIVEAGAQHFNGGTYTTVSVDNGTANTQYSWYEKGYSTTPSFAPNTGLPAPGAVFTSASQPDHHYKMAPSYVGNNIAYVDASTSATVTFATPANVWAVSFLTSAGHGPVNVNYVVHHADASTESGTFVSRDWFASTSIAWGANGRVDVGNGGIQTFGNVPNLLSADIGVTNITSPVTSIDLSFGAGNGSGAIAGIFAVSAAYMNQNRQFTSIQKSPGGSATLNFSGVPGYQYVGQFTTNLNPAVWQTIGTNVADGSGLWQLIHAGATNSPRGFYRALYLP